MFWNRWARQTVQVWNLGWPSFGIPTPGNQAIQERAVPMPGVWWARQTVQA